MIGVIGFKGIKEIIKAFFIASIPTSAMNEYKGFVTICIPVCRKI
jgi:hypothetical protein